MRSYVVTLALLSLTGSACDEESRACRAEVERAQGLVKELKSESPIESLRESVSALEQAIAACERAGLGLEKAELEKARNQVSSHLAVLERRAQRKKREKRSPEELAALAANGDPSCPKGQAYLSRETKQRIQCTGPQLIELTAQALKDDFEERRFRVTQSAAPPTLRAEHGAELYVVTFDTEGANAKVKCLEIYPPPGGSWQELTAKMTGVAPDKLKPGARVATPLGVLPLAVEDSDKKTVARIGECQR